MIYSSKRWLHYLAWPHIDIPMRLGWSIQFCPVVTTSMNICNKLLNTRKNNITFLTTIIIINSIQSSFCIRSWADIKLIKIAINHSKYMSHLMDIHHNIIMKSWISSLKIEIDTFIIVIYLPHYWSSGIKIARSCKCQNITVLIKKSCQYNNIIVWKTYLSGTFRNRNRATGTSKTISDS